MKKFILCLVALVPMMAMASIPEIKAIADDYANTESVTFVTITEDMMKLMAEGEGGEMMEGVSLDVLACEDAALSEEIAPRVEQVIANLGLDVITNINSDGALVKIYGKSSDEGLSNIVIYVREGGELATVIINGTVSPEVASQLIQGVGIGAE